MRPVDSDRAGELVRLCEGVAVVRVANGIVLEGGPKRQLITGSSASVLAERVLPVLRHPSSPSRIATETGLSAGATTAVLTMLRDRGLLEEGLAAEPTAAEKALGEDTRAYLSRTMEARPAEHRAVAQVAATLADSCVLHVGDSPVADRICADLLSSGLGRVLRATAPEDPDDEIRFLSSQPRLVVLLPAAALLADWNVPEGAEVLRYGEVDGRLEVGPLFGRVGTPCPACFTTGHARWSEANREAESEAASDTPVPAQDPRLLQAGLHDLLAASVVAQVLALLVGTADPTCTDRVTVLEPGTLATRDYVVFAEPDCPECVPASCGIADAGSAAEHYEEQVSKALVELQRGPDISRAKAERYRAAAAKRIKFTTAPRLELVPRERIPALRGSITSAWLDGARPGEADDVPDAPDLPDDEAVLSGILLRTAGRHESDPATRRWAPSGGNMGSVELYLVSERPLFSTPPGTLLRYDDAEHRLLVPHTDRIDVVAVRERAGLPEPNPIALLFLTGAVWRQYEKYRRFSYHLAHLDAGCALSQLFATAGGYGRRMTASLDFDPGLADLLELSEKDEILTAVVGLYPVE
jgi:bacteriocin biosynthesis cyclodehydratase domain-containing protein